MLRADCCHVVLLQVTVDGAALITMPGTLARYYQQQGGAVQLMGKPDPIIYEAARELLPSIAAAADPQQWLAIGDSLEHDIAG
jgi:ribonucleotide monophosphatase NagD (HAD superfamily)